MEPWTSSCTDFTRFYDFLMEPTDKASQFYDFLEEPNKQVKSGLPVFKKIHSMYALKGKFLIFFRDHSYLRKHSEWVGGVSQMLMLHVKPAHFTNEVCLHAGWVGQGMVQNMLT